MSIKLFTKGGFRHIIIKNSIDKNCVNDFSNAFSPSIDRYEVTFVNIKAIPKTIIDILYKIIYIKKLKIIIFSTDKILSNYLQDIGIKALPLRHNEIQLKLEPKNIEAVVIGGSADSLENIITIVKTIPLADISFFVVQHIASDAPLLLENILKDYTKYKVKYAENNEPIDKGIVYLNPPDYHMEIHSDKIKLHQGYKVNYSRPSISVFFNSFSKKYKNAGLALLTCGYGNDGSDALQTLKQNETTVILQNPSECEAKDMLINAKQTKNYDFIWDIDEIRGFFSAVLQTTVNKDDAISMFLKQIHKLYGYDFTKYDRGSVTRRIKTSMISHGINSFPLFVKETLTKQEVFNQLLLSISINVTEFFRRPQLYIALKSLLLQEFSNSKNLKIWVAGSSTGQEPYSIAMLLDEIHILNRSLIYATDFNQVIIDQASNGIYPYIKLEQSKLNADQLLKKDFYDYFDNNESYVTIKQYIRKKILFFNHNLVTDSSFNHFDIISCKNVMIYFTPALQEIVLQLFYDSLNENGYLQLGESEMLHQSFEGKFIPYDKTNKLYKKVG